MLQNASKNGKIKLLSDNQFSKLEIGFKHGFKKADVKIYMVTLKKLVVA